MQWRTPGMTSSMTVEWATPATLFRVLHAEFKFALDISPMDGHAIHEDVLDFDGDGLAAKEWAPGPVWMNPPYGRGIGRWIERAHRESQRGVTVVALLPARTDTSWWHDYCMKAEIRFLRGRLKFDGPKAGRSPFPSAIVVFRGKENHEKEKTD